MVCAGIFPGIHVRPRVGRALAVPDPELPGDCGPNFRSPLLWGRVSPSATYATVFAAVLVHGHGSGIWPPCVTGPRGKVRQAIYGFFALGWRGSHRHWHRYEKAYLLLAGLATPLVLSVHSVRVV